MNLTKDQYVSMQTWLKYAKPGDGIRLKKDGQYEDDIRKDMESRFYICRYRSKAAFDKDKIICSFGEHYFTVDTSYVDSFAFNEGEGVMVYDGVLDNVWLPVEYRYFGDEYHWATPKGMQGCAIRGYKYALPIHVYEAWQADLKKQADIVSNIKPVDCPNFIPAFVKSAEDHAYGEWDKDSRRPLEQHEVTKPSRYNPPIYDRVANLEARLLQLEKDMEAIKRVATVLVPLKTSTTAEQWQPQDKTVYGKDQQEAKP